MTRNTTSDHVSSEWNYRTENCQPMFVLCTFGRLSIVTFKIETWHLFHYLGLDQIILMGGG